MTPPEQNHIFWRDEILQLLFWMQGEGMGYSHSLAALARFLTIDETAAATHLSKMIEDGYLSVVTGNYALTDFGKKEGARRFKEEFDPLLSQGHGECNDPNCDCHDLGPEYCKIQTRGEHVH